MMVSQIFGFNRDKLAYNLPSKAVGNTKAPSFSIWASEAAYNAKPQGRADVQILRLGQGDHTRASDYAWHADCHAWSRPPYRCVHCLSVAMSDASAHSADVVR